MSETSDSIVSQLFDVYPDPMWVFDVETLRFLAVNVAAIEQYGYSRQEFSGMSIADIRPAEDVQRLLESVAASSEALRHAGRWRHRTHDGDVIDVDITSTRLRLDGRECVLVAARNVTDECEARRELARLLELERQARGDAERERAKFRALFESAPGLFLVLEPKGYGIVDVSDAYLHATLTTRDAIVGKSLFDVFPDDPNDSVADGVRNLRASLDRVVATASADAMAVQRYPIRKPGSEGDFEERFWSPVNSPIFGPDGDLVFIIHRVEDVTEYIRAHRSDGGPGDVVASRSDLQRMEAEIISRARDIQALNGRLEERDLLLAMAGRTAHLGGWVVNLSDGIVHWSDEVCAIHDMPSGTHVTVEQGISYYASEWRPVIREHFTACAQEGRPYDLELEIISRTGRRVWVRTIGEAVRGPDGRIERVQGAIQDISAWKEAQSNLEQLGRRLTRTLESIEGFITVDNEWRLTYVNKRAEKLLQRSRDRLLGRNLWEEFPDAVGSIFDEEYHRAMNEGMPVSFDGYFAPLDLWVSIQAYPSEDGLAIYFYDVAPQKKAEIALRESEERFRILARATADTLWDWDLRSDSVWWSEGLEWVFGYERAAIDANGAWRLAHIHHDDRSRIADSLERLITGTGANWEETFRFQRSNGTYALVVDRGFLLRDEQGTATRMVGGMTDRTEEDVARQRILEQATLLDQARDAILVRTLEHVVTFWNKSAERLYGWSADEAIGRSIFDLVAPASPRFFDTTGVVLERGEWFGEIEHHRKDGTLLTIEQRLTLVRDGNGEPHRIMCINTDITEQKKLQAQFLRAQRMDSIGTLAAGIAHDLNNVLAPIMMSTALLNERATDDDSRELLTTIAGSAARGAALVKQVLAFARGVDGAKVAVDLERIVADIGKIVRNTFPKSIRFESSIPDDLWPLEGDPTQFHQILLNLCVNARDAMPNGGVLEVRAENLEIDEQYAALSGEASPGRYVKLQVKDTGAGIPADIIDRVFDPFFSTKTVGTGTGLGLSTVHTIVRSHGGHVAVYSEPGNGTTFKVYMPAMRAGDSVQTVTARSTPRRGNAELILVVDDEASIRAITQQTLEAFGYRVVTATDGADAVAIYARRGAEIDLVITDMRMPIMDGPATAQVLRRMNPNVRLLGVSGLDSHGSGWAAAQTGIRHFLAKPYTAEDLLDVIDRALHESDVE